jgi:hypothetical protein
MKKSTAFIKLISLRLKFPVSLSSRSFYNYKFEHPGFDSVFEENIYIMSILEYKWAKYGWLFKASTCLLGLLYIIKKIIF